MLQKYKGHILTFFGIAFWGISGPLAKFLYSRNFTSFIIIQTRSTYSFLLLLLIFAVFKRELLKISFRDALKYMLLGALGWAGSNFFYYTCIKYVTVATGIMVQYTTPFFVMIYAVMLKQERYHPLKLLFLSIAFAACFFAISGGHLSYFSVNITGVSLALASAFTWSFYNIYNKSLPKKYDSWTELLYILFGTVLLWFFVNPFVFQDIAQYPFESNIILFGFAMISVLIPLALYNLGLHHLKASQATSIGLMEPVIVVIFAFFLVGETMNAIQAVSGIVVLVSIYLLEYFRVKIDADFKK